MAQTGYTPILNFASGTASAVPSASNMTSSASGAELAVNYADGKLFYKDSGGVVQVMASKATGSIGGSTTQVQFNNAGALGGSASLTWSGTVLTSSGFAGPLNGTVGATTPSTGAFTTVSASGNVTLSGGTANGVAYLNGSKVLTSGSALVFDSSDRLIVGGASAVIGNRMEVIANNSGQSIGIRGRASDASGTISWHANSASTEYARISSDNTSSLQFGVGASGSEQMRLTSIGLGIGTSSPQAKLHINSGAGSTQFRMGPNSTSSDRALINYNSTTNRFTIDMSGNDSVVVDGSGNLGLGVTPSAWASDKKVIQLTNGSSFYGNTSVPATYVGANFFENTVGTAIYSTTAAATQYYQFAGQHVWRNAPSGTAGNPITFTQAMTLDASGNLGVGTSSTYSAHAKLNVLNGVALATDSTNGGVVVGATTGGSELAYLSMGRTYNLASTGEIALATSGSKAILFGTNNTERARIDSSGNLIQTVNTTAATLTQNQTLTFSIVNNSLLRISVRGSDGTTRTATIALV